MDRDPTKDKRLKLVYVCAYKVYSATPDPQPKSETRANRSVSSSSKSKTSCVPVGAWFAIVFLLRALLLNPKLETLRVTYGTYGAFCSGCNRADDTFENPHRCNMDQELWAVVCPKRQFGMSTEVFTESTPPESMCIPSRCLHFRTKQPSL